MELGRVNRLKVVKEVGFGLYLDGGEEGEILLPARYVPQGCKPGDELDVFIYLDNEERLVATTQTPLAQVGDFACLQVAASEDAIFYPRQWQTDTEGLLEFVSENAMHIHQDVMDRIGTSEDFSQILAMSTCSSEFTDARTILLAVMKPYSPET